MTGSSWPTGVDQAPREQLVGADGVDALRRVGQLERAGNDPDPAHHETCEQAEPFSHAPSLERESESLPSPNEPQRRGT